MKLRSIFAGAMAVVATSAFATIHETTTYTAVNSDGAIGSVVNEQRNFTATGLTGGNVPYALGALKLAGTISIVNAADFASEGRIQITSPLGRIGAVQMFTATGFTTLSGTATIFVGLGTNPVGTWNFRFFESFNDGGDGSIDKVWDTITIDYTDEDYPSEVDPPTSEDKGTVCDPGMTFETTMTGTDVKWFKIEVPEATGASKYLDIDTEGTDVAIDTEIGLYDGNPYGTRASDDDDDGTDFLSQLSFGPGAGDRGNGGFGGANYNGRDGGLGAGTYYLAVGLFNTTFGTAGFNVTSTSTDPGGTVVVNLRTNMSCASVSGTVNLQNLDGDEEGCEVTFEIREVGSTTPIEVHTLNLGAGGAYSFDTSVADGTYDVTAKGTHWLRKLNGSVTFAGGATNVDFDLINGDCDPDNEVNIVDAGTLAAAFGSDPESENWNELADLDKDGEVTLVDNGILAANFGQAGDE